MTRAASQSTPASRVRRRQSRRVCQLRVTYSYDADNRRVQTSITSNGNINAVSYIYAGSQSVGEIRNQQLSHSLMTGLQLDEQIARIALISTSGQGATPQVKTYLTDALGSVIAIAKADQTLEVGYAYSAYGQTQKVGVENQQIGSENNSQYTGRENDQNGLYYYRARYYDPVLKRFISEDPIGLAGGINSHAYVEGDPVSLTDSTGLWAWGDPIDPDIVNAVTGFGDAFFVSEIVRDIFDIDGGVDKCSDAYSGGKITGFVWGLVPYVLSGGAALGAGSKYLSQGRYWRIGNGKTTKNARFGLGSNSGKKVPMLRLGNQKFSDLNHIDLRSRLPKIPPIGGPFSSCDCP